jgi:hypothetical protein
MLGPRARAQLSKMLGTVAADRLEVVRGERSTLGNMRETLLQAGLETPKATEMLFSGCTNEIPLMKGSMDGHLPPIPRPGEPSSSDK